MKSSTDINENNFSLKDRRFIARFEIFDAIVFVQMNVEHYYNEKHQSFFMKFENFVFIWLHREYDISFTAMFNSKLNQQYVDSFKILKKIERLAYRLKFSQHWRIHSMLSVIQLKSCYDIYWVDEECRLKLY